MATIQGTGGYCTIAGYNAKINAWNADIVIKTEETTGFNETGRTHEPVQGSMKGSATGICQRDAATTTPYPIVAGFIEPANGVAIALTATGYGGNVYEYTFTGNVSNVKLSRPHNGKMDVTFDFQSTGAVTQDWA